MSADAYAKAVIFIQDAIGKVESEHSCYDAADTAEYDAWRARGYKLLMEVREEGRALGKADRT